MMKEQLDPIIERRIEELLDFEGGDDGQATYEIIETTEADEDHPQIRVVPYDAGAAVDDALIEAGFTDSDSRTGHLRNIYLQSLHASRSDLDKIAIDRQINAADLINKALGLSPHKVDAQG